jgi:hypothetical protein
MTQTISQLSELRTVKAIRKWLRQSGSKPIRKIARLIIAVIFWAHALLIFHAIPRFQLPSLHWAGLTNWDAIVITVIAFYTVFGPSGWFSVLFDAAWIYAFPLLLLIRIGWTGGRLTVKFFQRHLKASAGSPHSAAPCSSLEASSNAVSGEGERKKETDWWAILYRFATLWGILIIVSNNKVIIALGTAVTMVAAVRSCLMFRHSLAYSIQWIEKFENGTSTQLGTIISKLNSTGQDLSDEDLRKAVQSLSGFEKILRFAGNKDLMMKCSVTLSLLLSLPYYLYISALCSFAYLGMARLDGLSWHWSDAIVDSLFMPLAWPDLPHMLLIRILGGLQATILVFLSFKAVFGQIHRKTESLSHALSKLQAKLEKDEVRTTILMVRQTTLSKPATAELGSAQNKTLSA